MQIRRVMKSDCGKYFETGDSAFDQDENGRNLDLCFYYQRNESGDYECFVLENEGEIVGVLSLQKQPDFLYLSRIGVKKGTKRKSHGAALLMKALKKAEEYDKKIITCKVQKGSWKFFESMGFRKVHEYRHSHWGLSALMELKLSSTES